MRTSVALAAVFVACVCVPVSAQSLVEAAEKAKAARATGQGWPEPAARTTPVVAPVDTAIPAAATMTDTTTVPALLTADSKTEALWRARLAPLTAQLATDRAILAPLEARYDELRGRYNGMRTVLQQQLVAGEMFRMQTEVRTAEALVDRDLAAIEDLKEAGRKAGAHAGWFR